MAMQLRTNPINPHSARVKIEPYAKCKYWVIFHEPTGQRRMIDLGKVSRRTAETVAT